MKRMKKSFGRILALLIACLSVGMIANAAHSASTEVEIAIEASDMAAAEGGGDNQLKGKTGGVKTGDEKSVLGYLLAAGVAVGLGGICVFKKKRKGLIAVLALFLSLFLMNHSAYAAEGTENVNVTIPSSISVCFDETGENSISEFAISNQSLVPITIDKVQVTECNDWKLCNAGEAIPMNTKMMAFTFENQCLKAEENVLDIAIAEGTNKTCNIRVERGAWTTSEEAETALQLSFDYTIGKKQFELSFDSNGGNQTVATQKVYNGESAVLPTVEREGYALAGWEDSNGNLYTETYVMPIGNVTLKAKWQEKIAYAIFVEADNSLRFVKTAEKLTAGSTYNGMTVTAAFTGFEETTYTALNQVPWYDGNYYNQMVVKKIIFEDVIRPRNTAYWFYHVDECEYIDVTKLDTSRVTDMTCTFYKVGFGAANVTFVGFDGLDVSNVTNMKETFAYAGRDAGSVVMDLSSWDVSKVTNMKQMFAGVGYFASYISFGDISKWNVSNVTDMTGTFKQTGCLANWYLDLRSWNVSKVTKYDKFDYDVYDKVVDPYWVY